MFIDFHRFSIGFRSISSLEAAASVFGSPTLTRLLGQQGLLQVADLKL